jgi:hypothetical protein
LQNSSYSRGVAQRRHPSSQAFGSHRGGEGLPHRRMLPGGWTVACREWRQPSRVAVVVPVEPPARAAGRSREFMVRSLRQSSREFTAAGARESSSSLRGPAGELERRHRRRSLLRLVPTIPFFLGNAVVWISLPEGGVGGGTVLVQSSFCRCTNTCRLCWSWSKRFVFWV